MIESNQKPNLSIQEATRLPGVKERDYGIYTHLMDAALPEKAEVIGRHFGELPEGAIVVDAGSGSALLAEHFAQDERLRVIALDISHELIEIADNNRAVTELVYADASEKNFPDNSVHIKYFSTSGHEIGEEAMTRAVQASFEENVPGGKLIIRDFAKPERTTPIFMHIAQTKGHDTVEQATTNGFLDYSRLTARALFDRFYEEFNGGKAFDYSITHVNGIELIRLEPEWAHEFYLRKDYTANWRQEIQEKYTYWTPSEARNVLSSAGYENVQVIPNPNQYILENRLHGKIALFDRSEDGRQIQLPFPDTHMVIVGQKPSTPETRGTVFTGETPTIDYSRIRSSISKDEARHRITVGDSTFQLDSSKESISGSKKTVYFLEDSTHVLKVVRTDTSGDNVVFKGIKAMYQAINRQDILEQNSVPHLAITETDPNGPPYRFFVQEAIPENAISAADLVISGSLTEQDVKQMASYINKFELGKTWQLDTNPFNWYRINKDEETQMMYVDGKVYMYDEAWEFRRVGLLQWIDPSFLANGNIHTAHIPRASDYNNLQNTWQANNHTVVQWWKKYLNPNLQP